MKPGTSLLLPVVSSKDKSKDQEPVLTKIRKIT